MVDFKNSLLYVTPRSPFARRVRLAFREHNLVYEEKVTDIFSPPVGFEKINPLVRIPVIILKSGETIVDSSSILEAFYGQNPQSPIKTKSDKDQVLALHWTGIALGVCETLVQRYLESLRPEEKQDQELLSEQKRIFHGCLGAFESFIENKKFIAGSTLTQADLDMGTALAYYELRYDSQWPKTYPKAAKYYEGLMARPSFQGTHPPPMPAKT